MLEIQKVSERILRTLEVAGWTIETLAAAKAEDLTVMQGIGPTTAWRIIVEARRKNRAAIAAKDVVFDPAWLTAPPAPPGLNMAPPTKPEPPWLKDMSVEDMAVKYQELVPGQEMPPMSVRVRRCWLRQRLTEIAT